MGMPGRSAIPNARVGTACIIVPTPADTAPNEAELLLREACQHEYHLYTRNRAKRDTHT